MIETIKFFNNNSEYLKNKLIIRPHPSEDVSTWLNELNSDLKDSVIIDHESTNNWILAARNVFSYYSTSLLETFMLGKIPYNLKFSEDKYFNNLELYDCCENILKPTDYKDLIFKVENSKKTFSFKNKKKYLSNTFYNIEEFNPDIVCKEIEKMFPNEKLKKKDKFTNILFFYYFKFIQNIKNFLIKKNTLEAKIYNQKNLGFTKEEVIDKMENMGSLLNIKDLKCYELYPGVFEITKIKH